MFFQFLCAMTMEEKVRAVEELFHELDSEIAAFQSATSLHCPRGCGRCCFHPDIEAAVLEFLPFAYFLYRENQAERWLAILDEDESVICKILNPTQAGAGLCSQYAYRGLICRLFGYSARTNKYGKKEMVTCSVIKTGQEEAYSAAAKGIKSNLPIPVMSEYYMKLACIDPDLSYRRYPINQAIRKAVEEVLHYFSYR